MGEYAYSAGDLLVWVQQDSWIETDQIVPDQVTPASDNTPSIDSGDGNAGIQTDYDNGDHQHPLQVSSVLSTKDTANGEESVANTYVRSDHTNHVNLSSDTPLKDRTTGTAGTSNIYARATHQHPANVDPSSVNVPLVNATAAANGTSYYYCRNDHVHPQQLTYDGNVTAIKFIKTGGQSTEVLCANGDTTTIDNDLSRTHSSNAGGRIRLCAFTAVASVISQIIEFKLYTIYNAVHTIILLPYYTVNGMNTVYGIFTAPTKVSTSYEIANGVNQFFDNHFGSGTRTSFTGITSGNMQINPTTTVYDNGLRISRAYPTDTGNSSIQLGCSRTFNVGDIEGKWSIFTSPSSSTNISQSSMIAIEYQAGYNSRGLQIGADENTLTFNGRVL
ncbi:MAG: hypothetical protein EZS28_020197 [Streblomastix strix]|uniref:Uncharacterized protein n=1 Tax=Streblomastix strix TaxID=222440 RepID=A0A5J4VPM5_9EUKA|nr:MAG: hypothetical protein EZS28_020197 [Streblomastix strix]